MRIIAGSFRSRHLETPPSSLTRPTSDRTRQAIFNILQTLIDLTNTRVLDTFAGSGAMGLEALSRGAGHITFIEKHAEVLRVLQHNIQTLAVNDHTTLIRADAQLPPKTKDPVELVFLDPPYGKNLALPTLTALAQQGWLKDGMIVVLEMGAKERIPILESFDVLDQRTYGAAQVVFLQYEG